MEKQTSAGQDHSGQSKKDPRFDESSENKSTFQRSEVVKLLEGLFKYTQASDDSGKTPQEKFDLFLQEHDLT